METRTTSRLRLRDLGAESVAGILQRPARTMLTALGVVLGIAAFVGILGMTSTATQQISQRFTALTATEVLLRDSAVATERADGEHSFPADAERRILVVEGTLGAGVYWNVRADKSGPVAGVPLPGMSSQNAIGVVAASPGLFAAVRTSVRVGRTFDGSHDVRGELVAVLGSGAAARLGVNRIDIQQVVFIGGMPFLVLGIIGDVERHPELLNAVLVPRQTAEQLWGRPDDPSSPATMVIDTRLGAAGIVAAQAAVALRPEAPELFLVEAPPDPRSLRDHVSDDLSSLFLLLAGIGLVIGAVGIANTTLIGVLERVSEIGLRRALGAKPRHIAVQFLTETGVLGFLGGLVGTSLGVSAVVVMAAVRHWTPVMDTWLIVLGPVFGALIGIAAGVYPAMRAARIEPVEALRR